MSIPEIIGTSVSMAAEKSEEEQVAEIKHYIRELFNVPNPLNQGLMRKNDVEQLCEVLKWNTEAISKACKANQYGVVEYENFEAMLMYRYETNAKQKVGAAGYIKKLKNQAKQCCLVIHPPVEEDYYEQRAREALEEEEVTPVVVLSQEAYHGELRARLQAKHLGVSGQAVVDPDEDPAALPGCFAATEGGQGPRMLSPQDAPSHLYRCPKCRFVLFNSGDVAGDGAYGEASAQKSISGKNWNKGGMPTLETDAPITSLFLTAEVDFY